jgi:L-lactate dehydrogenase complex protein LldG
MSSRENILSRIRAALNDDPPLERPPVPEVWPRTNPTTGKMVERFTRELEALAGEVYRCPSEKEARKKLAKLLGELDDGSIARMDRPLVGELTSQLPAAEIPCGASDAEIQAMAEWSASVVAADFLLADTGTSLVACRTTQERLMCYLPPVCIVVAKTDRLFEHLPAAWDQIARRAADPELRGEFVLITGPSRTADIEKILILGVHGPKRLVVLLVD